MIAIIGSKLYNSGMAVETISFTPDTARISPQMEEEFASNSFLTNSKPDKSVNYSLQEYIQVFGHTPEIKWHIENIEFGIATARDEICPGQLRELFTDFDQDRKKLRVVAQHEAGHFMVGENLGKRPSATTIPDGDSLGKTWYKNLRINPHNTENLREVIALSLAGGHAAGTDFGTGSDHAKARSIARFMSTYHKAGSPESILSSGHSDARRLTQKGSRRFMQVERILTLKRTITT